MTRRASLLASLLALASAAWGCAGVEEAPPSSLADELDTHQPRAVLVDTARRTTSGVVAVRNLDAQISSLRQLLSRSPGRQDLRGQLVDRLLMRTAYLGRFSDFDEADALTDEGLALSPDSPTAQLSRAAFLTAVHRFAESEARLDQAEALGAPPAAIERARVVNAIATGVDPEGSVARAAALAEGGSFAARTTHATALAAAGRFEEADALYAQALADHRDTSPFPHVFVSFGRGVMWAEMADEPEVALGLYREAVRRLPDYVVANVHLAELEAERASLAEARERLRPLVERDDPEPAGLLSELTDDASERAALTERARARYEALLTSHRAAFLDHGAEFFAGPGGDPERALAMARENLESRGNGRAYVVAIESALAAGRPAEACALARRGEGQRRFHPVLDRLVEGLACE